jgi:hypothetical protein
MAGVLRDLSEPEVLLGHRPIFPRHLLPAEVLAGTQSDERLPQCAVTATVDSDGTAPTRRTTRGVEVLYDQSGK